MASVQGSESVATTVVMRPDAPHLPKQYKEKRYKHNWRLDMLAVPKGNNEVLELFKMTQTQRDAFLLDNYSVQPKVEIPLTPAKSRKKLQQMKERKVRMNDLAIFPKRYYNIQKKTYTYLLGNKFEKRMNKHMKEAHDSIYNEYDRARIELKRREKNKLLLNRSKSSMKKPKSTKSATSSSSGKSRKKMTHEELLAEAIQWSIVNAKPKKEFPPPKINMYISSSKQQHHTSNFFTSVKREKLMIKSLLD